jgi:putative FmdB family regulatory protein
MPLYEFQCGECGHVTGVIAPMSSVPTTTPCEMGCSLPSTRIFSFNSGNVDYANPIVSQSLAMHPEQIDEHKRLFPDIPVTPDGCPVFSNFADHEAYLKKTGFVKIPGKRNTRPKSRNGVTVIRASDIMQEKANAKR